MAVPLLFRVQGGLSVRDLEGALGDLVSRHAGLRTTFTWADRGLKQVVHPPGWTALRLARIDCAAEEDPLKAAYQGVKDFLRNDMDLAVAPVRAALLRVADDDHLFVLDPHHIITDAWSNMLIMRDLATFYRARRQHTTASLPAIQWQHQEFAEWQRGELRRADIESHTAYHLNVLDGVRFLPLPPITQRVGKRQSLAVNEWFDLPQGQLAVLREIAREERTTLFVILLSLFFTALQEVTKEPDIAMGTIVANRARPEIQETVGLFANMMIVRVSLGPEPAIIDTIRAVRRSVLEGLRHSDFPYARLPPNSWRKGAKGEPRDVVFHMLAEPPATRAGERVDYGDLRVQQHHIPDGLGCRFEFEMMVVPDPDGLKAVIKYANDRFDPGYVRDVIRRYLAALAELIADRAPRRPVPVPATSAPAMTPID